MRYARDLDRLLAGLGSTHARVLVGNVPDLGAARQRGWARIPAAVDEQVGRWNDVIAATSARHGATVVDLHARWQEVADHPEYLSADGFHPSTEGYAAIGRRFRRGARWRALSHRSPSTIDASTRQSWSRPSA